MICSVKLILINLVDSQRLLLSELFIGTFLLTSLPVSCCCFETYTQNAITGSAGFCFHINYGFAKIVPDETYTLRGLLPYLASEIIFSHGYKKGVLHYVQVEKICDPMRFV